MNVFAIRPEYLRFTMVMWVGALLWACMSILIYFGSIQCRCNAGDKLLDEQCLSVQKETNALLTYAPTCESDQDMRPFLVLVGAWFLLPWVSLPCMLVRVAITTENGGPSP